MDDESLTTSIADEELYRHSSSRSQTVVNDANAPVEHDGRANTETHFIATDEDGPPVQKFGQNYVNKWAWLNELHQEHYSTFHNSSKDPALAKRDLRAWMNQLHCTDHQIKRACHIYNSTPNDSSKDGYVGGHCTEAVLLAIISVVLNRDVNRKVRDEDHFQELRSTAVVSKKQIRTVRKKVRKLL